MRAGDLVKLIDEFERMKMYPRPKNLFVHLITDLPVLHKNEIATVMDVTATENVEWLKLLAPGGTGWIKQDYVEIIK